MSVDRLSRSLLDFARLMDRFDQRSVSFVSVTQHFNTTTSLGRLTLNILLSFAQFEREIISERTRDKMSAARRKGKWVGGTPVLGYDVDPQGGRLVVNQDEAKRVRETFELYRRHRSITAVVEQLACLGWKTKSWKSKRGLQHKGRFFTGASLSRMLTNAIYAGKVEYRGAIYDGEHPAIVDPALWEMIRAEARKGEGPKRDPVRCAQKALLAGLLFCTSCERAMRATYSSKQGVRYRYYICRAAQQNGWRSCPTKSVRAKLVEDSVIDQLRARLSAEPTHVFGIPDSIWQAFQQGDCKGLLDALVEKIRYDGSSGTVSVKLRRLKGSAAEVETLTFEYTIPTRRGSALPPFRPGPVPEPVGRPPRVAQLVALAHKLEAQVRSGKVNDYMTLAELAHVSPARIAQIVILAHLAPDIQEYVLFLSGEHAGLISEHELREIAREPLWDRQRTLFQRLLHRRRL